MYAYIYSEKSTFCSQATFTTDAFITPQCNAILAIDSIFFNVPMFTIMVGHLNPPPKDLKT